MSYKSNTAYGTGDLARWQPDGNIEFLGRIDRQVKIRGFRIQLEEIQTRIQEHEDIKEAVVVAVEKEKVNTSLCAYVVPYSHRMRDMEKELKSHLARFLPGYMIPAYFVPVEKIPLNASGKVELKALPPLESYLDTGEMVCPRNELEEKLVFIWQEVLGNPGIGITDNFFQVGGDSIKAIQVSARLKKYGLNITINDLFLYPVIRDLAPHVTGHRRVIHQGIVTGQVELTPVQHWFFRRIPGQHHHFNQSVMLYREAGFDETMLAKVFTEIVTHHDALRMVFKANPPGHEGAGGEKALPVQVNRGTTGKLFEIEVFDFVGVHPQTRVESEIRECADRLQASIDLEEGPLVRLGLFKTGEGDHLLVVIHHLVVDGISWRILLEDIASGLQQCEQGKEIRFQPKTDSFKDWAARLKEYAEGKVKHAGQGIMQELASWKTLELIPNPLLPLDAAGEIGQDLRKNKYNETVSFTLDKQETECLLRDVNWAYNTEMNDILLTALGMAVKEWAGVEHLPVNLEGHGREAIFEDMDMTRTVGWFTTQYPVYLEMERWSDLSSAIKAVKEMLRRIPNNGFGYGVLKYLVPTEMRTENLANLEPQINFNYLGQFDQEDKEETIKISHLNPGENISPEMERIFTLEINGMILQGILHFSIYFNTNEYRRVTIEKLAGGFRSWLLNIIEHCGKKEERELTPSDMGYAGLAVEDLDEYESEFGDMD